MSNVDPQAFLDQTVQGAMSTQRVAVPKGDYPAVIDKIEYRIVQMKDGSGDRHVLDVTFAIDDETAREVTGLPKPTVRLTCWLDLTAESKLDLSKGRNVDLGRLREALGMNDPDKPFSFRDLQGQACFVSVEQNPSKDGKEIYANVAKVGKSAPA